MGTIHKLRPSMRRRKPAKTPAYELSLFTTGSTPRSTAAIRNLQEICADAISGDYRLQVVDIYQEPGRASEAQIIAAPTLIKYAPAPISRVIGDLSDHEKVISILALRGNVK